MSLIRTLSVILLVSFWQAAPAFGGGLFKKTPKPEPADQVPSLIRTLKSDTDDRKRSSAAEELREFDGKQFPDIVPALIEALQNDSSTSVRVEAANSIAKIRPITQAAGYALEQAEQNDTERRVRSAARSVLTRWTIFDGYRRGIKAPENQPTQTEEPPLAVPLPESKGGPSLIPPAPPTTGATDRKNPNRPAPPLMPTPTANTPRQRLLPLLPSKSTKSDAKPNPKSGDEGPSLIGPM
jgi:hypothetical protein